MAEPDGPRRLHFNESPFPPPDYVVEAVAKAARTLNLYPSEATSGLAEAIAGYAGVSADRIVLTDGSLEALYQLAILADAPPGAEIVTPDPTFPAFPKVARLHHLVHRRMPVRPDGVADVDAILAAITPQTALVCVPSPGNPTGGILPEAELARLCAGIPGQALFHLDEAYYEFGRHAGGPDTLPHLSRVAGRWLATRSASKAFGLAGVRLGYVIASDAAFAAEIREKRPTFNVNALALAAGRAAVEHAADSLARVAAISAERERLAEGLRALGLATLPSGANFIAFDAAPLGPDPVAALRESGILLIAFTMPGERPMLRASIGTAEDSDALLEALRSLMP
ncbi:MAG: aminotransferase class I/II-fold pyridoxal phosphate-dependent enzyme [Pseudomonadota bacterium]